MVVVCRYLLQADSNGVDFFFARINVGANNYYISDLCLRFQLLTLDLFNVMVYVAYI